MDSRWKKDDLSSLHLSVRSQNALGAYGVHTVDDLLNLPKFELLKIPNLCTDPQKLDQEIQLLGVF